MTDKVFDHACSTQRVYEEGAKDVAISALTGINGNKRNPLVIGFFFLNRFHSPLYGNLKRVTISLCKLCSNYFCIWANW